jgi:cysteine synthase B
MGVFNGARPYNGGLDGDSRMTVPVFKHLEDFVGNTPLVKLKRLPGETSNTVLVKLEGNNPAGSVKDRPALWMIRHAELRGDIKPGDTLIEPTSGNTGIGLAMAATMMGYKLILVMPENSSAERVQTMRAYGADVVLTPSAASMPGSIDEARRLQAQGVGVILDQFANPDNPLAHYESTGPEIWRETAGTITHFVSSMGTTGTIMGCSRYFKEMNPAIQIVGVQPELGSQIPGIRKWEDEYLPKICDFSRIDQLEHVSQAEAEDTARRLAREEGILAGPSSGGALAVALKLSARLENAVIVSIVTDRGDRYLSTGLFA